MFATIARLSYRFRWPVLIAGVILFVVGAVYSGGVFNVLKPGGYDDPGTESYKARQLSIEKFGVGSADLVALYTAEDGLITDPANAAAVAAAAERAVPHESVVLALGAFNTGASQFVSQDGRRTFVVFTLAGEEGEKIDATEELTEVLVAEGPVVTEFGGEIPVFEAFNTTIEKDLRRAELLAFPLTALLLVLIFRSLIAAAVPLILGALGIVLALSLLRIIASTTSISLFALNVVTVLGLGLAIDYSLFILNRYREEVPEWGVEEAIVRAVNTTGRAVAFSGVTLATSLIGLFVFPQVFLRSMAIGGIAVAILAVLIAITVLPALLGVLGGNIERLRIPWFGGGDEAEAQPESGFWHAIAFGVMRRPVLIAVTVIAFLLLLGVPFLRFNPSKQDARALPAGEEARAVSEVLDSEFQPHETTPHFAVVESREEPGAPESIEALFNYNEMLLALPGIARVDSVFGLAPGLSLAEYQGLFAQQSLDADPQLAAGFALFVSENFVRFSLISDFQIDDAEGQRQVADLRAVPPPGDADVLVGGNAADLFDTKESIKSKLPLTLGIIGVATFVVLFLVFGSVTLPLKAMLMNLMSLTASFGAIVFIFQDGRLEGLLNYDSLGTIDVTLPLLMFAIVFGLSMDYEVLMLSRVREEYVRTGDNTLAVARGLEKTGRLITSAAALLVVVIAAFATSDIALMKALGVGMALAVAIDATIVRALLVPATMRLMGHWNWWAPAPLYALWEKIGLGDLEGHGPEAKPSTQPVPAMAIAAPSPATAPFPASPPPPVNPATMVMPASAGQGLAYLVLRNDGAAGQTFELSGERTRVGRAPDNDVVIDDPLASAHHFSIERAGDGKLIVRDEASTNGTAVNGERIDQLAVERDVEISVGATKLDLIVVSPRPATPVQRPASAVGGTVVVPKLGRLSDYLVVLDGAEPGRLYRVQGDSVTIGRDPRNQVVLEDIKVSGFHARLQRGLDGGLIAEDWGSQNGTYLNGELLQDATALQNDDLLHVGDTTLQVKRVS